MKEIIQIFSYFKKQFIKISFMIMVSFFLLPSTTVAQGNPVVICSGGITKWTTNPPSITMNGIRVRCNSTLIIEPGVTVAFWQGAYVEVEAGSTLILRGKFTLYPPDAPLPWFGIFVQGNSSLAQNRDVNGINKQGTLILDGATIEHAIFGAVTGAFNGATLGLCTPNLPLAQTSGGIIKATNSTFNNNLIDINFTPYIAPGGPDNISYFNLCDSYITDDYLIPSQCPNDAIVLEPFFKLKGVRGVKIKGHIFEDKRTTVDINSPSDKVGIRTSAASIKLDRWGNNAANRTKFKNLDYGIRFLGTWPSSISSVRNADFECWHGMYLGGITNGTTISSNNFTIKRANNPSIPSYGVYLNGCAGYAVEYNSFTTEYANIPINDGNVGVIARNQHPDPTQIYNNDFDGVLIATEAIGQNTNLQTGPNAKGLEYRCNDFSGSLLADIVVLDDLTFDPALPIVTGIKEYQYLTANRFSENPNAIANLYNAPVANSFQYIHYNDLSDVRLSPESNIGNISVTESPQFPPASVCPEPFIFTQGVGSLKEIKEINDDLFKETVSELNSLIDNGNTLQLVNQVRFANNREEATKVYLKIIEQAPFTSDAVLEEVSIKEVGFSNAMIRNILQQHPQTAKSTQIQENLDNRTHPIPQFMRNQINQGLNIISAKEQMELDANDYKRERDEAINRAVQILGIDTLDRSNEMIDFLSGTNELGFQYRIANIYDQKGETGKANAILNDIAAQKLSEKETADHKAHIGLRALIQSWTTIGKDLYNLEEGDLNMLHIYAVQPNITAGKAIAILKSNDNTDYPEPVYFPELPSQERIIANAETTETQNKLFLYPNPSNDYINISYNTLDLYENLSLKLVDMTGKVLHTQELFYLQDEVTLITADLPDGQYICTIYTNGQPIESKQFTITK